MLTDIRKIQCHKIWKMDHIWTEVNADFSEICCHGNQIQSIDKCIVLLKGSCLVGLIYKVLTCYDETKQNDSQCLL